jgi:CAAX protease family protein
MTSQTPEDHPPGGERSGPPRISSRLVAHQEGIVAVVAIIGLGLRDGSPIAGLVPRGGLAVSVGIGVAAGIAMALTLWLLERLPPLRRLESWQRNLVVGWSRSDAVAIAVLSGLAEEALARALLQPLLGLVAAAMVFGLLHIVPDRRLWLWPVLAFVLGLALGVVFEHGGYPAAASAHLVINAFGLLRLRDRVETRDEPGT